MSKQVIQVVTDYTLVQGLIEFVEKTVTELIADQWQPLGSAFPMVSVEGKTMTQVCQTMVKHGFAAVNMQPTGRIQLPQLKVKARG